MPALDRLEPEPTLVAQPTPVDRIDVDALIAQDSVSRRLHRDPAPHRAGRAGRLFLLEIPGPRLEPVRLRGQRAHWADLHGVAAEVRGERFVGERQHLRLVATTDEADQRVAGDLAREPGAAVAEDAPLTIEVHEVADRDRLLEVPLLLDEPALPGTERERLVLQGALATLVADRAVERVVDEQELEDAVLRLLHGGRLGVDDHPLRHVEHAGHLQRRAARPLDLDEAHAAHAHRRHPRVVAEARDVHPCALGGRDHELTGRRRDDSAVDRERDRRRRLRLRHERPRGCRCTRRSRSGTGARRTRSVR